MSTRTIRLFENFGKRYFDHINDPDALKKEFRRLSMLHHPDRGGSTAEMQEINDQYKKAQVRIATGGTASGSSRGAGGNHSNQGDQNNQRGQGEQRTDSQRNRGDQNTRTGQGTQGGQRTDATGAEGGRRNGTRPSPEERASKARAREEKYRNDLAKAKEKLDRLNKATHDEYQSSIRENPSNFDNIDFMYKEELRQNKRAYAKAVADIEKVFRSGR